MTTSSSYSSAKPISAPLSTGTTPPEVTNASPSPKKYYVSITGLQLKSLWSLLKFQSYTQPAMKQALAADGNVSASGNYKNGVLHTLTVWEDRRSMARFMSSGAHAAAMKINDDVAIPGSTKVHGYFTDVVPTWEEAIEIWKLHAKRHGRKHGITPEKKATLNSDMDIVATPSSFLIPHRYTILTTVSLTLIYTVYLFKLQNWNSQMIA